MSNKCCVGIETTIGDENYKHLNDLVDYIANKQEKFNCKINIGLQTMCMTGKASINIEDKCDKIIDAIEYGKEKNVDLLKGMIVLPLNNLKFHKTTDSYCAASGREICVYPNGDIYPCAALKLKMGHVNSFNCLFKNQQYQLLAKRIKGSIPDCRGCEIEAFCAGGCVADANDKNGNIFKPTNNCEMEKKLFKRLVQSFI